MRPNHSFPVIVVANQKGGAGKTTLTAHLSCEAALSLGWPVFVADFDAQGSLGFWWGGREADEPRLLDRGEVPTPAALRRQIEAVRRQGSEALLFIDTMGGHSTEVEDLIALADLVIIPCNTSSLDLHAAGSTVAMARQTKRPFLFVISRAETNPRVAFPVQAVAALSQHGPVAQTMIHERTDYKRAINAKLVAREVNERGKAALEIGELWQEIAQQLDLPIQMAPPKEFASLPGA